MFCILVSSIHLLGRCRLFLSSSGFIGIGFLNPAFAKQSIFETASPCLPIYSRMKFCKLCPWQGTLRLESESARLGTTG
ncbi:hypothetical protein CLOSTMETH_03402 [[Clostridium] methylpentosum DSM 5476]|uniref:Uncharacterized protein n=1 Tax=[Clostridium] methylpentosum DSM 5476 TaxID=537013 RepID=C0EHQ7_9FIRM|nr:hypothetical protein CLOSTMETH_03402 [[Clostridium] methylpentosum DSM 5476]